MDRRRKFNSRRREVREGLISEMTLTHSLKGCIGFCHIERVGKVVLAEVFYQSLMMVIYSHDYWGSGEDFLLP